MKIRVFYDKPKKKVGKIVCLSVISVLAVVIIFIGSFLIYCVATKDADPENGEPIRYRMQDDFINGDARLIDIAILGAHDAFADSIDKNSVLDPVENGIAAKIPALKYLSGGLYNTQTRDPYALLDYGVRYFDIRLSRHEESWHVKHAFIAGNVKPYIEGILRFLSENSGEVVLLDFQHAYYGDSDFNEFSNYILGIDYQGKTLKDYAITPTPDLPSLRYKTVTENGKKNAVLMFFYPHDEDNLDGNKYFFDRKTSIRSTYHAVVSVEKNIRGIEKENEFLKNEVQNLFVVMQAIPKNVLGFDGFSVNLNSKATKENYKYIENPNFVDWLHQTPIFMVNNTITTAHDFQQNAIKIISDFNKKLAAENALS